MSGDKIVWADEFSVHIQEIDEQHKVLIGLLNELYQAMHAHRGSAACREILNRLAEYTRTHFLLEESLMRLTHYPEFEAHKGQHEELIQQVLALQAKLDAGTATISFELLHFLKNWLTGHIMGSDKRFGMFFKTAGLAQYGKWSQEVEATMKKKKWWWKFW